MSPHCETVKVGGVIVVHRQKVITLDVKKTRKKRDPFDDGLYVCHAMFELWFFYPRPPSGLLNVIEAIHKGLKSLLKKPFFHEIFVNIFSPKIEQLTRENAGAWK